MLERYPGNPIHNHAFIDQIHREILNYTRCLTYWTYTTLCNQIFINYHRDDQPRFGIKPAMKYTNNKFLMSLATVIEGRTYDWKMDFTGSNEFPHTLDNKDNVESLLREMYSRIWAYSNKMNAKQNFRATKQTERGQHARPIHVPHQEKDLGNSLNTLRAIISEVCDKMRNKTGGILWEKKNTMDLSGRFSGEEKHSVFEVDGDVTYNPQQRIKFAFMGVSNHGKKFKIEVFKHFPYRRPRGFHVDMENKKTTDWLNSVLPHVSRGWYEVIITYYDDGEEFPPSTFKLQLVPWERRNTTWVHPFAMVADDSKLKRGEEIFAGEETLDCRDFTYDQFQTFLFPPYLIQGKGNEIDAIVHSLRILEKSENIEDMFGIKPTLMKSIHRQTTNPNTQEIETNTRVFEDEEIFRYMRAYFSSDAKTGVVGDRSVFFFNVQGVVVGVEMSSPSLPPHVDYQDRAWQPRETVPGRRQNQQRVPPQMWYSPPPPPNYVVGPHGGPQPMPVHNWDHYHRIWHQHANNSSPEQQAYRHEFPLPGQSAQQPPQQQPQPAGDDQEEQDAAQEEQTNTGETGAGQEKSQDLPKARQRQSQRYSQVIINPHVAAARPEWIVKEAQARAQSEIEKARQQAAQEVREHPGNAVAIMDKAEDRVETIQRRTQEMVQQSHAAPEGYQEFRPSTTWSEYAPGNEKRKTLVDRMVYLVYPEKSYVPETIYVEGLPFENLEERQTFELNKKLFQKNSLNPILYEHVQDSLKTNLLFITVEVDDIKQHIGPVENKVCWVITYNHDDHNNFVRLHKTENQRVLLGDSNFTSENGKVQKITISVHPDNDGNMEENTIRSRDITDTVSVADYHGRDTYKKIYNIDIQNEKHWAVHKGRSNFRHCLQIYPSYRRMPLVDTSGLVPRTIHVELKTKNQEDHIETFTGEMHCVDCKIPQYEGAIKAKSGSEYTLTFTHYVGETEYTPQVVWGIKCGRKGRDEEFIAYHDASGHFNNLVNMIPNPHFGKEIQERTPIWVPIKKELNQIMGAKDLILDVQVRNMDASNFVQRIPNFSEEESKLSYVEKYQGMSNLRLPMTFDEIKADPSIYSLHFNNGNYLSREQNYFKVNSLQPRFLLHLFSGDYLEKLKKELNRNEDGQSQIGMSSAPKTLFMSSWWLNNPKNEHIAGKIDEDDGQLELVDIQGPIYVSKNGKYMVGPTLAQVKRPDGGSFQAVTWGVHRWNASTAEYEIMAVKMCGERSRYLINEPQINFEQQSKIMVEHAPGQYVAKLDNRGQLMFDGVYQVFFEFSGKKRTDTFTDVILFLLNEKNTKDKQNPYQLRKRYPDYAIPADQQHMDTDYVSHDDIQLAKEMYERDGSMEFLEGMDFHLANALKLEIATDILSSTRNGAELCAPGLAPVFKSGGNQNYYDQIRHAQTARGQSAKDAAGKSVLYPNMHNRTIQPNRDDHSEYREGHTRFDRPKGSYNNRRTNTFQQRRKINNDERILPPIYDFTKVDIKAFKTVVTLFPQTPWDFCTYFVMKYLKWASEHPEEATFRRQGSAEAAAEKKEEDEDTMWSEHDIREYIKDLKDLDERLAIMASTDFAPITKSIMSQTCVEQYPLNATKTEIPLAISFTIGSYPEQILLFTLQNPYHFKYECKEHKLILKPSKINGISPDESKYVWKIVKTKSQTEEAVVAIKNTKPFILINASFDKHSQWTFFMDLINDGINTDELYQQNQSIEHTKVWNHPVKVSAFEYTQKTFTPRTKSTTPMFKLTDLRLGDEEEKSAHQIYNEYTVANPDGRMWALVQHAKTQKEWAKTLEKIDVSSVWSKELLKSHPEKHLECPSVIFIKIKDGKEMKMYLEESDDTTNDIKYYTVIDVSSEEGMSDIDSGDDDAENVDKEYRMTLTLERSQHTEAMYNWCMYATFNGNKHKVLERTGESQYILTGAMDFRDVNLELGIDHTKFQWMNYLQDITSSEKNKIFIDYLHDKIFFMTRKAANWAGRQQATFSVILAWHEPLSYLIVDSRCTTGIQSKNAYLFSKITSYKPRADAGGDYLLRQCFDSRPAAPRLPPGPRKLAAPVRTFAAWRPAPAPAGVNW